MASGGKRSTTWEKGKTPPVKKPKGAEHRTTKIRKALGIANWDELKGWAEGEGIKKCITELSKLKGKDYVYAYNALLEFVKPKLQRTTIEGDLDKPLSVQNNIAQLSFEELMKLKYGPEWTA